MKKILFFSNNENKKEEISYIFDKTKIKLLTLSDFPKISDPKESGDTFEENASIKSNYGFNNFNIPCFADDSGICISALKNLPGTKSKRFIQDNGGEQESFKIIFREIKNKSNKNAFFKTSISLTVNNKTTYFNGELGGTISDQPRGNYGFGYDPIFIPNGYNKTFGEMLPKEKNKISHRYIAIKKLQKHLSKYFW